MRWLVPGFVAAITVGACSSKDTLLEIRDGAVESYGTWDEVYGDNDSGDDEDD